MIDIKNLSRQIKKNCNISDAKFWGTYSVCGLLIRLRELYCIEMGVKPWEKIQKEEIGKWISERENLWKELEDKDFENINVNGDAYGPFEVKEINGKLEKEGFVYGGGIGVHMKPSFFIADLASKEKVGGFDVYIAGHEYARDLADYPAMLQDRLIFARVDTTKLLLWGKFEEMRCRSKGALEYAFLKYGIKPEEEPVEALDRKIYQAAISEVETYIHHELGEALEGGKIGDEWKIFLTSLPDGRSEIFARAVKDALSDTSENGMLKYIIKNQKEGSLGFYIVFLGGMRKILVPEILEAFRTFTVTGDWAIIDTARKTCYKKAEGYAERLLSLYRNKKDMPSLSRSIETEILSGLL